MCVCVCRLIRALAGLQGARVRAIRLCRHVPVVDPAAEISAIGRLRHTTPQGALSKPGWFRASFETGKLRTVRLQNPPLCIRIQGTHVVHMSLRAGILAVVKHHFPTFPGMPKLGTVAYYHVRTHHAFFKFQLAEIFLYLQSGSLWV